ncbi:acyl carrier protein [Rhizobium sp. Root149]|jgi:acyl carrier protein|uniref:Acyl carrier protein n=1 Tax=Rhizobium rhizoryzae TaxID=451876 RepID=A0A7W6LJH6_9HYPH|nr:MULTISPECIES: acyl carrier protein [Rhizobium]KQZ47903.1 acyl carrier protein [Rhizobium sp. Root149]MBB4145486.1 acyl carrier protein [Rhizobium rhizoryzae]
MSDDTKAILRAFIVENFLFGDESQPLTADTSLIDSDYVDSTGILELVSYLEERFGIKVADTDIIPANLDSLARITAFVERKQAG